jgi:hypothetical protein
VIRTIVTLGADDPDLWVRLQHERAVRRRDARTEAWLRLLLTVPPTRQLDDKDE